MGNCCHHDDDDDDDNDDDDDDDDDGDVVGDDDGAEKTASEHLIRSVLGPCTRCTTQIEEKNKDK